MLTMQRTAALSIVVCLLFQRISSGVAEYFEECEGVEDESFVASSEDCRAYIYCDGEDSMLGECSEGQYFDTEQIDCDYAENVYCPLDYEYEGDGDDEEEDPVTTTILTTIETTESTPTSTFDPLTVPPVIKDKCPLTDDPNQIVLIANSQSCTDYYLCYHGHAIEMQCTNHLHFNTYTGKCDFPENVQCLNDRPNANKCLPHVTDFFPHPEKCNYFYYCIRGYMTIQQCPFYYGWDIERRSCVHISQAKCFHNERKITF